MVAWHTRYMRLLEPATLLLEKAAVAAEQGKNIATAMKISRRRAIYAGVV